MTLPYDRDIAAWLADGPDSGPAEPLASALAVTRRTRKRPRWTFPERWLPMQLTMRRPVAPRALVYLALLALLIAALGAAIALLPGTKPLPAPLGATNGSIAYDAGGQIYLAAADGSDPRPIAQPGKYAYTPVFSPDGSQVAYLSNTEAGQLHVFVANADGSDAHQVSTVPYTGGGGKFPPAWSPDGTRLVHYLGDGGIWVMAADGSTQQRIAVGWSVAWSPDGQWIAFRSDGSPNALLRVIHPDGTGIQTLTTGDPNTDAFATIRWLSDSSGVVFHRGGVWSVGLDGVERRLSTKGGYPTVSPDGRYVAYLEEVDGGEVVKLVELTTGEISTLGPGGCLAGWAPDSTAVVTYANGCFKDIQIIPLDDPSAAIVLDLPGNSEGFPGWQTLPAAIDSN